MNMGLSGPFWRLDVLGFKKALKIALQASDTVRQAILGLLLYGYTGVTKLQGFYQSLNGLSALRIGRANTRYAEVCHHETSGWQETCPSLGHKPIARSS